MRPSLLSQLYPRLSLRSATALLSITAFPGSDTSRVAAGVVTGLGFLGAGTILKGGDTQVRGLTTAGGMWAVGAIGLAIGSGRYFLGLATAMIAGAVLLSERILRIGERLAHRRSASNGEDLRQ